MYAVRDDGIVLLAVFIAWIGGTLLGVLVGYQARSRITAFIWGATIGVVVARLAGTIAGVRLFALPQCSDLIFFGGLPGVTAGVVSAAIRANLNMHGAASAIKAPFPLSPDAEQAARSHFNPKGQQTDVIRQAEDGVEVDGKG